MKIFYNISQKIPNLNIGLEEKRRNTKALIFYNNKEIGWGKINVSNFFETFKLDDYILIDNIYTVKNIQEILKNLNINFIKQTYKIALTEDAKNFIKEQIKFLEEEFEKQINNKNLRFIVEIIGCDFERAVLTLNINDFYGTEIFNILYNFLKEKYSWAYHAYEWLPQEKQKKGLDVTEDFWNKVKEIEEKEKIKKEKFEKKKQEAKEKNQKVLLYKYSTSCHGKNLGCDVDNVYVYILPNGEIVKEIIHCY